jgi:hypothetical protein
MNGKTTKVHDHWLVTTHHVGTDLSDGHSLLPLTWQTTVTDLRLGWSIRQVARYPTEDSARRGHNRVVAYLKGGGVPSNYK